MRARTVLAVVAAAAASTLALSATPVSAATHCHGAGKVPTSATLDQTRETTLCLLNAERRKHGLAKLRENEKLRVAAERHSEDMEQRHYFDHVTPGGVGHLARVRSSGYLRDTRSWSVGENIAWGSGRLATPRAIVRSWMQSPGHRENILSRRYRDIGIGLASGTPQGGDGATYTTNFGARS